MSGTRPCRWSANTSASWPGMCAGTAFHVRRSFTLAAALDDLLALLDSLQVAQAVFVGHSMGGNLHQELVFHHPERVKALVCLDCTWNFQKLTALETFSLRIAGPIFKLYPHKLLVDQSLAVTATSAGIAGALASGHGEPEQRRVRPDHAGDVRVSAL